MSHIVTVPTTLVDQLRNALHDVLSEAASEVSSGADHADRSSHPEWYEKPIQRFKQTEALLDVVGWGTDQAAVQIDLRTHHRALMDALKMALLLADTQMAELETVEAARAARHEPTNREATIKRNLELNEWASAVSDEAAGMEHQ